MDQLKLLAQRRLLHVVEGFSRLQGGGSLTLSISEQVNPHKAWRYLAIDGISVPDDLFTTLCLSQFGSAPNPPVHLHLSRTGTSIPLAMLQDSAMLERFADGCPRAPATRTVEVATAALPRVRAIVQTHQAKRQHIIDAWVRGLGANEIAASLRTASLHDPIASSAADLSSFELPPRFPAQEREAA